MAFILRHTEIRILCQNVWLDAFLCFAPDVRGLILSLNSSAQALRESNQDRALRAFRQAGFGTLQLNLLTAYEESRDPDVAFNVPLLAQRLEAAIDWLDHQPGLEQIALGIDAAGSSAAAAIRYMTDEVPEHNQRVSAIVGRAARIDLAGAVPLRKLGQPLLLVLPEHATSLHNANLPAYDIVQGTKRWSVVEGGEDFATNSQFLNASVLHAGEWFVQHLGNQPALKNVAGL